MAVAVGMPIRLAWPLAADIGLEVAGIAHIFSTDTGGISDNGTRFDGRVGLPIGLTGRNGRFTLSFVE